MRLILAEFERRRRTNVRRPRLAVFACPGQGQRNRPRLRPGNAHGVVGVVSFLVSLPNARTHELARRLALDGIGWLHSQKRVGTPLACIVGFQRPAVPGRRFGWCWGELGIAVTVESAARVFGHEGYRARAAALAEQPCPGTTDASTTSFDLHPARRETRGRRRTQGQRPEVALTSVATTGTRRRAGVTAGAQRREPRRDWRVRAAARSLREPSGQLRRRTDPQRPRCGPKPPRHGDAVSDVSGSPAGWFWRRSAPAVPTRMAGLKTLRGNRRTTDGGSRRRR